MLTKQTKRGWCRKYVEELKNNNMKSKTEEMGISLI
jgi:hypothetical protein